MEKNTNEIFPNSAIFFLNEFVNFYFGIVNVNVEPFPNILVKERLPPNSSIIFLVNGNPNPVPSIELVYLEFILLKS